MNIEAKKPRFLVTAGPTREAIDPVRYISNRSSGKMGFAIAEACVQMGCEVILICGPGALPTPEGVDRINVETAEEMAEAVAKHQASCKFCIFAAAVSDYRADQINKKKIKRGNVDVWSLRLVRTRDVLGEAVARKAPSQWIIGFAAETENVLGYAREKLINKGCDMIVANDVSRSDIGFDADENQVTLVLKDDREVHIPQDKKPIIGLRIVEFLIGM